jgi:hypothetical protein
MDDWMDGRINGWKNEYKRTGKITDFIFRFTEKTQRSK